MEEDAKTLSPKGAGGAERQAALPIAGGLSGMSGRSSASVSAFEVTGLTWGVRA